MNAEKLVIRPKFRITLSTIIFPLIALLSLPNLIWISLDQRVWPWDQAWYAEVTADLYFALSRQPDQWFDAMRKAFGLKPPLLAWVGQLFIPLGIYIGDINFSLLLVPILTNSISLYLIYLSAKIINPSSNRLALMSLIMLAAAPIFAGMANQYFTETLQILIVVASYYVALSSSKWRVSKLAATLLLLISLAMAVKSTTALYCGLAWLVCALFIIRRTRSGESLYPSVHSDFLLLAAALFITTITLTWYVTNFEFMLQHIRNSTVSDVAFHYGSAAPFINKLVMWTQQTNANLFLLPMIFQSSMLIITGTLILSFKNFLQSPNGFLDSIGSNLPFIIAFIAYSHVILVLIVLSNQINEETRFLAPITVPFIITFSWALSFLRLDKIIGIPLIAIFLAQFGVVHMQALGLMTKSLSAVWLLPVIKSTDDRKIAESIVNTTCPEDLRGRTVVIGIEKPMMNANSMAMYSSFENIFSGRRCFYTGLGYAEVNPKKAIARIEMIKPSYIVLPIVTEIDDKPNYLNQVLKPIHDYIVHSPSYTSYGEPVGAYQIYRSKGDSGN